MIRRIPHFANQLWCVICGHLPASVVRELYDGLPKGLTACAACRKAVKARIVGVCLLPDGTLHIVDAREVAA